MPEIKHNFTSGKMNKDLDERLVPNGEYRHALNVQVSGSDSSNAGSIQNILGNKKYDTPSGLYAYNYTSILPADAVCVGSISDEKSDSIYYFIYSPSIDFILEFSKGNIKPVFVDVNKNALKFPYSAPFNGTSYAIESNVITAINIIDDLLFWSDGVGEPKKINITTCKQHTIDYGVNSSWTQTTLLGVVDMAEEHITVIKKSPTKPLTLDLKTDRPVGGVNNSGDPLSYTGVFSVSNDSSQQTDNIIGVTYEGSTSVDYSVSNFNNIGVGDVVQVIIPEDINGNTTFELDWHPTIPGGGASAPVGGIPPHTGRKIVIKEFENGESPPTPITDYRIKGVITDWYNQWNPELVSDPTVQPQPFIPPGQSQSFTQPNGYVAVEFEITATQGTPPSPDANDTLRYAIDLFDETEKLFEFKFPRFSYRYKYNDNEYSCFAPWTQVAFVPGSFDYHPKKGYNIGMTNRLSSVVLSNFVPSDIPDGVKEVDILYKEEGSTTVYVVENIKSNAVKTISISGSQYNYWDLNSYTIDDETINTVVPQNQSVRPWDNVPVKSLAQEITGNRIVYGNYTQGHDIDVVGQTGIVEGSYYPQVTAEIVTGAAGLSSAVKSIKSLREYQLGVLFVDKYGRETPILTNPSATLKVEKDRAIYPNKLKVGINTPNFVDNDLLYYKFFIKETAGEYYNLAMDRWYDAGDGNKWLSFPSSDRNKIDIDTFLILKKAAKSDILVTEPARYKILAIENEAPDYIKTAKRLIDSQIHTGVSVFGTGVLNNPVKNETKLILDYIQFETSSGANLHDIKEGVVYVEFGKLNSSGNSVPQRSNRYRVTEITKTAGSVQGGSGSDVLNIILEEPLGADVDFISDDPSGLNVTQIEDNATVRFYHYVVENDKKFDGRFFVKIFGDDVFRKNFEVGDIVSSTINYRVINSKKQYSLFNNLGAQTSAHDSGQSGLEGGHYDDKFGQYAIYFREYSTKDADYQWSKFGNEGSYSDNIGRYKFGPDNQYNNFDPEWNTLVTSGYGSFSWPLWWRESMHTVMEKQVSNPATGGAGGGPIWTYQAYSNSAIGSQSHYERYAKTRKIPYDQLNVRNTSTEVWFVDNGYYTDHDGGGTGATSLTWSDNPDNPAGGFAQGFESLGGSDFKMTLGFGPISYSSGSQNFSSNFNNQNGPVQGEAESCSLGNGDGYNNLQNQNHGSAKDCSDFWNIGNTVNNRYGDSATVDWISMYNVGSQWRWKEDPNQNIYTITGKSEKNILNYASQISGTYYTSSSTPSARHFGIKPDNSFGPVASPAAPYSLPVNFRKQWTLTNEPASPTWVPDDSSFGVISGGHKLSITATTFNNNTSDFGAVGTLEDYCIYLSDNNATCATTNQEGVTVKAGMILTRTASITNLTANTYLDTSPMLLVKKVTKQASHTKVELCGYVNALEATHCITPVNGELVTFGQAKMNGYSPNSAKRISLNNSNDESADLLRAVGYTIEFVSVSENDGSNIVPENPAIWETEPKDESDLDIYYEASGYQAIKIMANTVATQIPIGSRIEIVNGAGTLIDPNINQITPFATVLGTNITSNNGINAVLQLDMQTPGVHGPPYTNVLPNWTGPSSIFLITRPDGSSFTCFAGHENSNDWRNTNGFSLPEASFLIEISDASSPSNNILNWHNCYSFLNGVESNRIRDNFNLPYISNGARVSTVYNEEITQENRKNGLIYSGIYNSITGINNLNQFIQAEKITKDINPTYGSIQKLHSRDTDLITLCEDKVLKILANKDALYNADGKPQLTANINVLGQTIPFVGEYGISKNPESFASESYRAYFTDKQRGAVIRLSKDGLTPISNHGMKNWFRDNLNLSDANGNAFNMPIFGSYDDKKNEYNVTIANPGLQTTVSFNENVKGWVSFKSFIPENGVSCTNEYYTFKKGHIYKHHDKSENKYNTFYNVHYDSRVQVLFNDAPGVVKSFKTINYEGSQSRIELAHPTPSDMDAGSAYNIFGEKIINQNNTFTWVDNLHYNEKARDGWYIPDPAAAINEPYKGIETDLEKGSINEFIEKEGKYFNYIKGREVNYNQNWEVNTDFDTGSLNVQGLGLMTSLPTNSDIFGCTDLTAFNYNDQATVNATSAMDGTSPCIPVITGCIDPAAYNYDAAANTDDGSCELVGCTDDGTNSQAFLNGSLNQSFWIENDHSPYPQIAANNFDVNANTPCSNDYNIPWNTIGQGLATYNNCCTYDLFGCTDSTAFNYNPNANTDCNIDATAAGNNDCCIPTVLGCTDPQAGNYDITANTDDSSCEYLGCTDPLSVDYINQPALGVSPSDWIEGGGNATVSSWTHRGFVAALAGVPTAVDEVGTPTQQYGWYSSTNNCGWGFYEDIFGIGGVNSPPAGVGVLIPQLDPTGACSAQPLLGGSYQYQTNSSQTVANGYIGCDPNIPYQTLIPNTGIISPLQQGSPDPTEALGNWPPQTPDPNNPGGYLPTWPDISYALDINGNQIPFTHSWWNFDGVSMQHQLLTTLVNPLPPCANVDDGSCTYDGCPDPLAGNYDPIADATSTSDCFYCGNNDSNVDNYDGAVDASNQPFLDGCLYCNGSMDPIVFHDHTYNSSSSSSSFDISANYTMPATSSVYPSVINTINAAGHDNYNIKVWWKQTGAATYGLFNWDWMVTAFYSMSGSEPVIGLVQSIDGLTPNTSYDLKFEITCDNSTHPISNTSGLTFPGIAIQTQTVTTAAAPATTGCMDPIAINYDSTHSISDPTACNYSGCMLPDAGNYIAAATIPCTDQISLPTWMTSSVEISEFNNNGTAVPVNAVPGFYWAGGLIDNVNNGCCMFGVGTWPSNINSASDYFGCTDPSAENYCDSCVVSIHATNNASGVQIPYCEYDGCHLTLLGDNPDINFYCADAQYIVTAAGVEIDQVYNPITNTSTNLIGTPVDANGLCPGNGYAANNYAPYANSRLDTDYTNCTIAGCGTGVACNGLRFNAEYVECPGFGDYTNGAAGDLISAVNDFRFIARGFQSILGSWNNSSIWKMKYSGALSASAQGWADYRQACRVGNGTYDANGNNIGGCAAACYDSNGNPDPSLVNTVLSRHLPPAIDTDCVFGNNTIAIDVDGNAFSGPYIEFRYDSGQIYSGWNSGDITETICNPTAILGDADYLAGCTGSGGPEDAIHGSSGKFMTRAYVPLSAGIWDDYFGELKLDMATLGPNGGPLPFYNDGNGNSATALWRVCKQCSNGKITVVAGGTNQGWPSGTDYNFYPLNPGNVSNSTSNWS